MNVVKIDQEVYANYLKTLTDSSFVQDANWGRFKETIGWRQELLGFERDQQLICAVQVQYKSLPRANYQIAYCAGGLNLGGDDDRAVIAALARYLKSTGALC